MLRDGVPLRRKNYLDREAEFANMSLARTRTNRPTFFVPGSHREFLTPGTARRRTLEPCSIPNKTKRRFTYDHLSRGSAIRSRQPSKPTPLPGITTLSLRTVAGNSLDNPTSTFLIETVTMTAGQSRQHHRRLGTTLVPPTNYDL